MEYSYFVSGNAPILYPADTCFGLLYYDDIESLEIPKCYPYSGEWGSILSTVSQMREQFPVPQKIDLIWLSVVERQFYSVEKNLPSTKMEEVLNHFGNDCFSHIVIGMAPFGGLALWMVGPHKAVLVAWMHAERFEMSFDIFMPDSTMCSLEEYCNYYISNDSRVKGNLELNGLPPRHLFDNYMKQFTYRYLLLFEQWDDDKEVWQKNSEEETAPEFDYIEEALFDGTHDKLHDGGLMKYHEAGKPQKVTIQWHIKKSKYTAYFWFDDEDICSCFDRFYGAHPETKTDFIIRIDAERNKYELALYRYGIEKPRVISEQYYQLLVFKNKFECYRSDNYNQERGAWIW